MRVIFLDIDGVLVNRGSFRLPRLELGNVSVARAHPDCIAAFNKIVEATDARIVVSSVWRCFGISNMRDILKRWGIKGKVIGCTPDYKRSASSEIILASRRGNEIQAWLDSREKAKGDVESFVIIDDDDDMEHLIHRLVQTEFEPGLTTRDAQKAIALLSSTAPNSNQPSTTKRASTQRVE